MIANFEMPVVVAHRGGRWCGKEAPWPAENTLAAFERAAREGARAIELDVRTCKTGEVVVFHDESLERLTEGAERRLVADVTWGELARLRLAGDARIPLLAEVLAWAAADDIVVNVELKRDVPSRIALAREASSIISASRARVALSSFEPRLLAAAAAYDPRTPRAILTYAGEGVRGDVLLALSRAPLVFAVHVEHTQISSAAIARWKRRGLKIGVWTVNDPREAAHLLRLGADYIITDCAGLTLDALDALYGASSQRTGTTSRPGGGG